MYISVAACGVGGAGLRDIGGVSGSFEVWEVYRARYMSKVALIPVVRRFYLAGSILEVANKNIFLGKGGRS